MRASFILLLAAVAAPLSPATLAIAAPSAESPVPPTRPQQAQRGWLGVQMGQTPEGNNQGVPVRRPLPSSPAEAAGIVRGDVIQAVNGTPVHSADALIRALANLSAGTVVSLDLAGANPRTLSITLANHPGSRSDFGRMMIGRPLPPTRAGNLETGALEDVAPRDGKVRIVELWATWCGPCRVILPQLSRWSTQLDKERFELVSIASEDRLTVQAFVKARSFPYRVLFDANEDVASEYWATATPTFILVGADGVVVDYVQGIDRVEALFQRARELTER